MTEEQSLPPEIEEWLRDVSAHREAAERIGAFYKTIHSLTRNETASVQLTSSWMMICYGMPKNMPLGGTSDEESP